jgi:hypothetical protein
MTSKVQMIVNGESYVLEYKLTNKEGFETSGAVRGAKVGQGFLEVYVPQDAVLTVTEKYDPLPTD